METLLMDISNFYFIKTLNHCLIELFEQCSYCDLRTVDNSKPLPLSIEIHKRRTRLFKSILFKFKNLLSNKLVYSIIKILTEREKVNSIEQQQKLHYQYDTSKIYFKILIIFS